MKVKTETLIGEPLHWAVAKVYGFEKIYRYAPDKDDPHYEPNVDYSKHFYISNEYRTGPFRPSTDYAQGGPLLDNEFINFWFSKYRKGQFPVEPDHWFAEKRYFQDKTRHHYHHAGRMYAEGPTRLIAGLRCIVATYLGDKVDIPDELL